MKFESQLQIVTAAGVPPFTVNQTALVINLNADLLDGQHGSYYAAASSLGNYLPLTGGTLTGTLTGTVGIFTTLRATELTSLLGSNGPITITPDGTGHVHINSTDIRLGPNNTNATLATRGTGDLILRTHEGSAVEGSIRIYDGANGNIEITPNGTGTVVVGKLSGSTASFSGQITSTVATGTAPLVITSTTAVTNLNADLLDGQHASYFENRDTTAVGFSGGTLTLTRAAGNLTVSLDGRYQLHRTNISSLLSSANIDQPVSTFDYSNPTGGPAATWINGWISSHSNYLHSIIVNAHRTSDWFVGYMEEGVTNPTWHKLLHSSNFNTYALPLAGGTLTGELSISTGGATGIRVNSPAGNQSFWLRVGYDTDGTATPIASALNTMLQSSGGSAGTFTIVCGNTKTATLSNAAANFAVALQQGGNQVVHAGNVSTYALPITGGALTGTISIDTSGSTALVSSVIIKRSGQSAFNFGQYLGAWRSALQIQSNSSDRLLFLAPPEADYQFGILRSANGGLKIDVGGTTANQGTNAVTIDTAGTANFPVGLQQNGNAVLTAATTSAPNLSVGGSAGSVAWTGVTGKPTTLAGYGITDALSSTINQQGGKAYTVHDFNTYPSLYNVTFVNPTGSTNLPTGMAAVMSYRFIMGAGDTATRGFDLVGAAEGSANLYIRERSIGTWSRLLHSNNFSSYALPLSGGTITGNTTFSGDNHLTFGPNSTWSNSIRIGGNGYTATGTQMASVATTNGNLHLDSAKLAGRGVYLNWYGGTAGTYFGNGSSGQVGLVDGSGNASFSGTLSAVGAITQNGNQVLHAGNYGGYSTFTGAVTSGYGTFASPGHILGDAQYGLYVASGNLYYKSGSGGVHYWRNKANTADTFSISDSGNAVAAGSVTATNFSGPGTGLTGTAASLTAGAVPWSGVTGKPTTLAGYGITDALNTSGTAQTKTGALTINGDVSLTAKVSFGNRSPIYTIFHGGAQDLAWKKIADIAFGTALYSAATFRVDVMDANTNFGSMADCKPMTFFVSCRRSGGVLNDSDNALVFGPVADYVRAVKTATGVYELQIRQIADWLVHTFTSEVISQGAGTVTYVTGTPPNGSTTGTVYTATAGWTQRFPNLSITSAASFGGQITSTVATGTAPLVIASTTAVTNLNSDLLDGQHGSYFENRDTTAVGFASGTLTLTRAAGNLTVSLDGRYLPLTGGTLTGALNGTTASFSGNVKGGRITLRDDCLEQHVDDSDSVGVFVNYFGFASGTTRFRNFGVFNGKNQQLFYITGSTGAVAITGTLSVTGLVSSGGNNGFANATWSANVRNPIWSFGNATTYGISYFQGSAGIGSADTIGIHPNGTATATGSAFAVTPTASYVNNNVVLHAGNYNSYAAGLGTYNTLTAVNQFRSNVGNGIYLGASNTPPLQAFSNDGGAAFMSFHRGGAYAVNMGLDPDNVLRIGGWSASSNRWQLDMSGNQTLAGNLTAVTGLFSGNVGAGTSSPYGKLDLGPDTGRKLFIYGQGGNVGYITGLGVDLSGSSALSFFTGIGRFEWVKGVGNYPYASYTVQMTLDGSSNLGVTGSVTASSFSGPGTGLTGTAASLNIGGTAATATNATQLGGNAAANFVQGAGSRGRSTSRSNGTASNLTDPSGFYYGVTVTGMPTTDWWNWIQSIGNDWSAPDGYGYQLACSYWSDDLRLRRLESGTWKSWVQLLHSGTTSAPNLSIGGSSARWATGRTISLTGDVTGTSGAFDGTANLSFVATIPNSIVTNAKLNTMGAQTIKGNNGAVANSPSDLTPAQVATMLSGQTMNINGSSASCTGNAATATTSVRSTIEDTRAAQRTPNDYDDYRASYEFTNQITGLGDWHSAITLQGWHNGYAAWQIIGPSSTSAHENFYLRSGVNTTWNTLRTILHSGNYSSYALPLTGGTMTGAITINGVSNAVVVQTNGNAAQWYGRVLCKNSTSDKSSFLGTYGSIAGVFAHNNALSAWADLYINTVDGSTGGTVRMPSSVLINGNQALHAGNYTSYSPSLTGGGASGTWGINISGSSASCSGNAATCTTANGIADGTVSTTAKLANSVVTYAKIQNVGAASVLGNTSASVSQAPQEITFANLGPYINGVARAWVTFNENPSTGAITINASLGISSVTRINYGQYRVNFSTAFADANYAVSGTIGYESNGGYLYGGFLNIPRVATPKTTTYCEVTASYGDGNTYNARFVHVVFDR